MTPLAHHLAKQLTLPIAKRSEFWRSRSEFLSSSLDDVHCFEVSAVMPLALQMDAAAADLDRPADAFSGRVFCPAPKTWIEFNSDLGRIAFLVEEGARDVAEVTAFWRESVFSVGHISTKTWMGATDRRLPLGIVPVEFAARTGDEKSFAETSLKLVQLLFVIINSPKVIGRRQHMPHRGLEKALGKAICPTGQYPLHAWSEIVLEARPTFVDDSGQVHEAHLTGRKCLHFCRAHLRVRNGQFEIVGSHWRGDPALGIKRSRYKLVPPRRKAA